MNDRDEYRDAADTARLEEVDAALFSAVVAVVFVIALVGIVSSFEHGWLYGAANVLPAAVVGLRRLILDDLIGIRRAVVVLVASAFVAGVGGTALVGGVSAPGVFSGCLVAMFAMVMFPARRVLAGLGVAYVLTLLVIDLVIGRAVDLEVLASALVLAVAVPAGVQRIVALETLHRTRSVIDPLTGCLNRRALASRSAEIEAQAERVPMDLAIVSFDVDHFKLTNDEHGHAFGDRVLAHVAYTVRKALRSSELVYRTGGEEFVVLLPGVDEPKATAIAERVRSAIGAESVEGVSVTASFGVAAASSPFDIETMVSVADERVYAAKAAGRDCVVAAAIPVGR